MNAAFSGLEELSAAMRGYDSRVFDQYGQWRTDLPVFGGAEPGSLDGVWSWDATRLLVGTCAADLEIVERT